MHKYKVLLSKTIQNTSYCGVISIRGDLIFVDFLGYPYTQKFTSQNVKQSNKLHCIVMQLTSYPQNYVHTNQVNFDNLSTLVPMNKCEFTVFYIR